MPALKQPAADKSIGTYTFLRRFWFMGASVFPFGRAKRNNQCRWEDAQSREAEAGDACPMALKAIWPGLHPHA